MFPHDKLDWNLSRLDQRLEGAPDDAVARLDFARAAVSRAMFHDGGEVWFNTALTQGRRLLQHDPTSTGAQIVAGLALAGLGRPEPARRYLDEALKLEPERADVHLALGELYRQEGDRHQAVRELEIACRQAPESWEAHALLGRLLGERAAEVGAPRRLVERAQFHVVRALQLGCSPAWEAPLLHELGVMCLRTGRYADALKLFTRLQSHERYRDRAAWYLGLVAYHLGKYKNAIVHHRRYLDKHPENAHVHARIGMSYLHLGEVAKAREACNRALAIEPGDPQARWTLACALLEEDQLEEAVRLLRELLHDAPDHLPAFSELVRLRRDRHDATWLIRALRTEVGHHDRLPPVDRRDDPSGRGSVPVDPREVTRQRIGVILDALAQVDQDTAPAILEAVDLTTHEGLRFQLFEAALAQIASRRAHEAVRWLEEPGVYFDAKRAREIITLTQFLPEALLTRGLQVTEDDLKRAAVDRHGPARDVEAHRANVDRERQQARAWQALLLLAIATRPSRPARTLLVRWASDADAELADAARAALTMLGDEEAAAVLRGHVERRGAVGLVDDLVERVQPSESRFQPRPVSDDESLVCATCGRRVPEVDHLVLGATAAICNLCMTEIARRRRDLLIDDPEATCALSGRTALETRALYAWRGVVVSAEVVDESLGLVEREEVDRYLGAL